MRSIKSINLSFHNNSISLSEEEIRDLSILAENGDKNARETLFAGFVKLAYKIAAKNKFHGQGLEYEDLIQTACEGLALACKNVKASKFTNFYTYAYSCIEANIKTELCRCNINGYSFNDSEKKSLRKVVALVSNRQKTSSLPLENLIADAAMECGLDYDLCKDYYKGMNIRGFAIVPGNDGSKVSEETLIPSEYNTIDEAEKLFLQDKIQDVLKKLTPVEADVLARAFALNGKAPETGAHIAASYNKTRAWASLTLKHAQEKILKADNELHLCDFLK